MGEIQIILSILFLLQDITDNKDKNFTNLSFNTDTTKANTIQV